MRFLLRPYVGYDDIDVDAATNCGILFANVPDAFIPASIPAANQLNPPDSYGFLSGTSPFSQPRGIGTLPGGIPVVKNNTIAGGIGVFFPGKTGFATEENSQSVKNTLFDPNKPDRSLEAEFIAFAPSHFEVEHEVLNVQP